jgi:hypothetical protein
VLDSFAFSFLSELDVLSKAQDTYKIEGHARRYLAADAGIHLAVKREDFDWVTEASRQMFADTF